MGKKSFLKKLTCMSNLATYIGSPRNFNNGLIAYACTWNACWGEIKATWGLLLDWIMGAKLSKNIHIGVHRFCIVTTNHMNIEVRPKCTSYTCTHKKYTMWCLLQLNETNI
jgi:hypothetical protein